MYITNCCAEQWLVVEPFTTKLWKKTTRTWFNWSMTHMLYDLCQPLHGKLQLVCAFHHICDPPTLFSLTNLRHPRPPIQLWFFGSSIAAAVLWTFPGSQSKHSIKKIHLSLDVFQMPDFRYLPLRNPWPWDGANRRPPRSHVLLARRRVPLHELSLKSLHSSWEEGRRSGRSRCYRW
jgi:hypothetical protein